MTQGQLVSVRPTVSVVVVNFNGLHHLERCLPALARTVGPAFETIVVDNGSSDGSIAWLARDHPDVRVLPVGENLGFGAGNQRGVQVARGEYVAFLNNDTIVDPIWLSVLVQTLAQHEDIGAACSVLKLTAHPKVLNAIGGGMTWLGYGYDRSFGVPWEQVASEAGVPRFEHVLFPTAAAMLMRKRDFLECGGYDPTFFMYHEDVDLGWRLWLDGKRVVVCRDSVVHHDFGGTSEIYWGPAFSARLGSRHNLRSLIKNYEAGNVFRALGKLHTTWARELKFTFMIDAWRWNLPRLRDTLRERRRIQRKRVVSDRELFEADLILRDRIYPPTPPALPTNPRDRGVANWLALPVLLPGEDSALGRIGEGWYAPEVWNGEKLRWTCGLAKCFLRVRPRASGTLGITLRPHGALSISEVLVECNGEAHSSLVSGSGWQTLRFEATADDDGVLTISIRSAGSRGVRGRDRVGCAVKEIRFEQGDQAAAPITDTFSVVIPTYNRWQRLAETLTALDAQSHPPFEVIIVDDGSTDGTWSALNKLKESRKLSYELKVLHQQNGGPGSARNAGVRLATGRFVLFLGDDTTPDKDCLKAHLDKHREVGMDCAVVGYTDWCRKSMRVTPFLEMVNSAGYQFGYGRMRDGSDVPFTSFYTSNITLPTRLLMEEPFHPAFKQAAWEDIELGYRLSLRGLRIVYTRRAMTHHVHPMNVRDFLKRQRLVGEKSSTLFECHPSLRHTSTILPRTFPTESLARLEGWLRWLVPIVALLDKARIPLPPVVYHALLISSFCQGIEQSRLRARVESRQAS